MLIRLPTLQTSREDLDQPPISIIEKSPPPLHSKMYQQPKGVLRTHHVAAGLLIRRVMSGISFVSIQQRTIRSFL